MKKHTAFAGKPPEKVAEKRLQKAEKMCRFSRGNASKITLFFCRNKKNKGAKTNVFFGKMWEETYVPGALSEISPTDL